MDFNDVGPQKSFDVIPAGTVATLHLTVRPGNAGDEGWLKRSKAGNSEALDCELVVVDGPYAKRKFWALMLVEGTTDGHAQAADITRRRLRGILESARGIRPDDNSDAAKQARTAPSYADFNGLRFIGKIGIEKSEGYADKNCLLEAITPDRREWHRVEQVAKQPTQPTMTLGAPTKTDAKIERPQWAK